MSMNGNVLREPFREWYCKAIAARWVHWSETPQIFGELRVLAQLAHSSPITRHIFVVFSVGSGGSFRPFSLQVSSLLVNCSVTSCWTQWRIWSNKIFFLSYYFTVAVLHELWATHHNINFPVMVKVWPSPRTRNGFRFWTEAPCHDRRCQQWHLHLHLLLRTTRMRTTRQLKNQNSPANSLNPDLEKQKPRMRKTRQPVLCRFWFSYFFIWIESSKSNCFGTRM